MEPKTLKSALYLLYGNPWMLLQEMCLIYFGLPKVWGFLYEFTRDPVHIHLAPVESAPTLLLNQKVNQKARPKHSGPGAWQK